MSAETISRMKLDAVVPSVTVFPAISSATKQRESWVCAGQFYHKNRTWEKSLGSVERIPEECLGGLVGREQHDVEIFLGDQVPFHPEAELIAAGSGKDQRGNIDSKVRNLQTVADDDSG